jgi:hypothetical protein
MLVSSDMKRFFPAAAHAVLLALVMTSAQPAPPALSASPGLLTAFVTGYTFASNDPPYSAAIAHPGIRHQHAGGVGTYADPITLAVFRGRHPPGAMFYIPHVQRYFVVEDDCATCTGGEWLDMWIGGTRQESARAQENCARSLTGTFRVEINPPRGRPVSTGPLLARDTCYRPG